MPTSRSRKLSLYPSDTNQPIYPSRHRKISILESSAPNAQVQRNRKISILENTATNTQVQRNRKLSFSLTERTEEIDESDTAVDYISNNNKGIYQQHQRHLLHQVQQHHQQSLQEQQQNKQNDQTQKLMRKRRSGNDAIKSIKESGDLSTVLSGYQCVLEGGRGRIVNSSKFDARGRTNTPHDSASKESEYAIVRCITHMAMRHGTLLELLLWLPFLLMASYIVFVEKGSLFV